MAGASDKARFYLEQYVPELQEYERKGIFTREEITSIASKRSDFEHTLNARGSKPSDYARYATYEMNLDLLRKKRSKRLGVKSTTFSGQRTVFFILGRATKKFPGDIGLWMQYIHFCEREKANKKLAKVFTNVLRLKPREWGLWVLAAKHYAESQGDMGTARSYMQRGLRFCKDDVKLWLEHMRLEMVYLAKLAARRKILGLDEENKAAGLEQNGEDEDMILLPAVTSDNIDSDASKGVEEVDTGALQKLASTPALTGGIPIAIFDAAMKQFKGKAEVAEDFFELVASFNQVPSTTRILQHILDHMQANAADSTESILCEAKMPLFSVDAHTIQFPAALGSALASVKKGMSKVTSKSHPRLGEKVVLMLLPYLRVREELDEDVVKVLESRVRRYLRVSAQDGAGGFTGHKQDSVAALLETLRKEGKELDANVLQQHCVIIGLG